MCKFEQFLLSLGKPQSNREYWIMTEIFVYLHNGEDFCNCKETAQKSDYVEIIKDLEPCIDWANTDTDQIVSVLKKHFTYR